MAEWKAYQRVEQMDGLKAVMKELQKVVSSVVMKATLRVGRMVFD